MSLAGLVAELFEDVEFTVVLMRGSKRVVERPATVMRSGESVRVRAEGFGVLAEPVTSAVVFANGVERKRVHRSLEAGDTLLSFTESIGVEQIG